MQRVEAGLISVHSFVFRSHNKDAVVKRFSKFYNVYKVLNL
jgi:hypothetical protein